MTDMPRPLSAIAKENATLHIEIEQLYLALYEIERMPFGRETEVHAVARAALDSATTDGKSTMTAGPVHAWWDPENQLELLVESLAELRKANSAAREGAISSVEVKFTAATRDLGSKPAPVIKAYAGSPVPVDEAVEAYGRALLLMERALMDGWERTVNQLDGAKS